jgi:hypothetical protein
MSPVADWASSSMVITLVIYFLVIITWAPSCAYLLAYDVVRPLEDITKTVQQTGNTIVHAEITATNPAHRIVDVTISDSIFEGAIGSSTLATALSGTNPKTFPLTSVNPESSVTLVHEIEVANGSANIYSDKATAKYTDHAFPDVTIPGQTEATAQANVVVNTSNANSSGCRH